MKVGAIHMTTMAVEPIREAFRELAPHVELVHFMDTGLLTLLTEEGVTPILRRRIIHLIELAEESGVGCIQLTGSAFNPMIKSLQPLFHTKIFRSDEAMLDEALSYEKICLVSTAKVSVEALSGYLKDKKPSIQIESVVNEEALKLLLEWKQEAHDNLMIDIVENIKMDVDVIVLTQYSLAHIAARARTVIPILSAPQASASKCAEYLALMATQDPQSVAEEF